MANEVAKTERSLTDLIHEQCVRGTLDDPSQASLSLPVQRKIIMQLSNGNGHLRTQTEANLQQLKDELSGPAPTPLERLLIERILTCWLEVNLYDAQYADFSGSLQLGNYYQKRQDRAHRRYLSAVKALAQVRRLELPAIQVNIGQHQVNALAIQNQREEAPRAIENVNPPVGEPVLGLGAGMPRKALPEEK